MKTVRFIATAAIGIATGGIGTVHAQSEETTTVAVPRSAVFVGFGGSYNSVNFINQRSYSQGVSNVSQNGTMVAFGLAGGQTNVSLDSQSRFAPMAQAGYMRHIPETNWLWGVKFSYAYLGANSTRQNVLIPQAGSFTTTFTTPFTATSSSGPMSRTSTIRWS